MVSAFFNMFVQGIQSKLLECDLFREHLELVADFSPLQVLKLIAKSKQLSLKYLQVGAIFRGHSDEQAPLPLHNQRDFPINVLFVLQKQAKGLDK